MDDSVAPQKQLEDFANDLLTEKNLPGLTDDVRPMVVEELVETLHELINRALIDTLPDDKVDELSALLDNADVTPEQIFELIKSSGIDSQQVVTDTLSRFRDLYLQGPEGTNQ